MKQSNSNKLSSSSLKKILSNDDVLTRFRLLQLWTVDIFTNSLKDNEPSLSKLINETMLNTEDIDETPEHMLNVLIELKKEYEEYNKKLEKINKLIIIQNKYAEVLSRIDDSIINNNANVDDIIMRNKKLINGINELNINSFQSNNQSD